MFECATTVPRYDGVEAGILEGFGKLFPDHTRLFVYPELGGNGGVQDFTTIKVANSLRFLYRHLIENQFIFGINCSDKQLRKIYSREVLAQLPKGRGSWEQKLLEDTSARIIRNKLFGYRDT